MLSKRALSLSFVCAATLLAAAPPVGAGAGLDLDTAPGLAAHLVTWLLPLGVALVAVGVRQPARAYQVAVSLPLALVAALAGYALCGFGLQYGGVGLVSSDPAYAAWLAEWSPLDLVLGDGWGLLGLRGLALPSRQMTPPLWNLLLAELPLVTTAALLPLVALDERIPRLPALALAFLVAAVIYPLMGNWVRAGGWLMHLGQTLRLGQGYRDDGLVSLHLVGAGAALSGLVALRRTAAGRPRSADPALPAAYLPLNVLAGAFLALLGWWMALLSQPLISALPTTTALPRLLAAAAAGALTASFYGWLVRGRPDVALTARAMLAATLAVSAGVRVWSLGGAALLGGVCGLLLAPAIYVCEHTLRLDDRAAALSTHGLAALAGLLAAAAPGGGLRQLYAQLLGVGALLVISAVVPWALFTLVARAFELPEAVAQLARQRATARVTARRERVRLRRQGDLLTPGQRLSRWYRQRAAAAARRRMARPLR
ncbi:MAG: hypothetical protein GX557_10760 [Chloroflexi bacterium]|nr:hypothetical protein [Chloroflexota bacterium]